MIVVALLLVKSTSCVVTCALVTSRINDEPLKVIVPDEYVPPLGLDTAPLFAGPAIMQANINAPFPVLSNVLKEPMLEPLRKTCTDALDDPPSASGWLLKTSTLAVSDCIDTELVKL